MLLLGEFWGKINEKLDNFGIPKENVYYLSLNELLKNLNDIEKLKKVWERRSKRAEKLNNLVDMPQVITDNNLPWNFELLSSWTFIWEWIVNWEIIFIQDINSLFNMNFSELKWKILFLQTATPEIDPILSKILDNVEAIVTKYWWPWAHITLRVREENKRRKKENKKEIPIIVGIWEQFETLLKKEKISLDFNKEKIW
jgi:hypothetical protein